MAKKIDVLAKEVDISINFIKGIEQDSFLCPEGVVALTKINQFAREFFEGTHGLTSGGRLVPFPEEKKALPHPCESLSLDVNECAVGLTNLQTLLKRTLLERKLFKGIEPLSLQGLHLHNTNGAIVFVSRDEHGIVLSER